MTTSREMSKINKLLEIIKKEGPISKVRLVMMSGISLSYYEKLKPFLEEIYSYAVQYDKSTKTWRFVNSDDLDPCSGF